MSELHPALRKAQQVLAEAGIRTVKHGDRLVQYEPGIVGPYQMVTVERLANGRLHVGGRTPDRAREVLAGVGAACLRTLAMPTSTCAGGLRDGSGR